MDNYVITIARGFGSGGKEIGTKLGERFGGYPVMKIRSLIWQVNKAVSESICLPRWMKKSKEKELQDF